MTAQGSFVFNGTERVIVSQVTRSPSVYFTRDKDDNSTLKGQLYPSHGMWVEIEQGANELLKVVLDRTHKITLGLFLKCFGYTNEDIMALFGNHRLIKNVLEKEPQTTQEEALIELARKTRPADVPSAESTRNYINLLFFSDAYYDINRVGRYKMNLKLSIANRITGHISADNIAIDDEIVVKAGEEFTYDVARRIQDAGINEVYILANGERHLIRGNNSPMMHAQAKSVAVRALPNGTEYLFTAVDLPRADKPDMPPAGEMQVFVTVLDGQAPVFTKVIR